MRTNGFVIISSVLKPEERKTAVEVLKDHLHKMTDHPDNDGNVFDFIARDFESNGICSKNSSGVSEFQWYVRERAIGSFTKFLESLNTIPFVEGDLEEIVKSFKSKSHDMGVVSNNPTLVKLVDDSKPKQDPKATAIAIINIAKENSKTDADREIWEQRLTDDDYIAGAIKHLKLDEDNTSNGEYYTDFIGKRGNKKCELLTSFDGFCVWLPYHHNIGKKTIETPWFHTDQNSKLECCWQAMVTLYDQDWTTGGLAVIPKSHVFQDLLLKGHTELIRYPEAPSYIEVTRFF